MIKVIEILRQLRETNSSKDKEFILRNNSENELLKNILYYTYNPFLRYGISEKQFDKFLEIVDETTLPKEISIFNLLDRISKENSSNLSKAQLTAFAKYSNNGELLELYKGMMLKDLKLGLSSTTTNKVWKNLIPKFDVQLAKNIKDVKLDPHELIFITEKLDGIRCLCIKKNDNIDFYTRQGKLILGLQEISNKIKELVKGDMVLDGELLADNPDNLPSGELYNVTKKIVTAKNDNKIGINFCVFDILPVSDFEFGQSMRKYNVRRATLETVVPETGVVKRVPLLYYGNDHEEIGKQLKLAEAQEKEGVMVNRNEVYECKRTKHILKVKSMQTVDLEVIGYKEGTGANKGLLGALVVNYKGYSVDVGSGFTAFDRFTFWETKEDLIERVIEVQYFEETKNEKGGISLRFPVFKELREIGKEVSYN